MPIFANIIEEAFSPLITLFESVLVFVHDHIVGSSWGLAIVGLTVIVRAIMVPLTLRQLRSMQKMQLLAPQLKEIQAKYKDDKQRQNEEMMKFYRENGVNPFGACLPLLLQLPVFISLFYALRQNLKLDICGPQLRTYYSEHLHRAITSNSQIPAGKVGNVKGLSEIGCNTVAPHSAKFLFLPDITVQAAGIALIVLIVLYVGSQLASTLMMSASAPGGSRGMMLALPFVFVLFIFRFPAGLLVYWITTNVWTMGQQYFVKRTIGAPPAVVGKKGEPALSTGGGSANGNAVASKGAGGEPALAGVAAGASVPPPPPRKKKKRSGRRR
ncbi:MAG TPA: YidC/Oxa1 family membrane protein insertase [Solirubrobacteraceae bacterium]|jgi:YidC/Oxa1 family membrane protein insertase